MKQYKSFSVTQWHHVLVCVSCILNFTWVLLNCQARPPRQKVKLPPGFFPLLWLWILAPEQHRLNGAAGSDWPLSDPVNSANSGNNLWFTCWDGSQASPISTYIWRQTTLTAPSLMNSLIPVKLGAFIRSRLSPQNRKTSRAVSLHSSQSLWAVISDL